MVISRIGMCVELRDRVCGRVSELSILDGSFRKKSVSFPSWSPLVRLSQLESSGQTFTYSATDFYTWPYQQVVIRIGAVCEIYQMETASPFASFCAYPFLSSSLAGGRTQFSDPSIREASI